MRMSCFVPSCNNAIGVAFPENPVLVEKWLNALNLKHLQPHRKNFVCFDHFKETDFLPSKTGLPKIRVGSIPVLRSSKYKNVPNICRVCMSEKDLIMDISHTIDGVPVMSILMLCCYPIKISLTDSLPKEICKSCVEDIKVAHKLRLKCLDSVKQIQIKVENEISSKRKLAVIEEKVKSKKVRFEEAISVETYTENRANINKEIDKTELEEFIKIPDKLKEVVKVEEPEECVKNVKSLVNKCDSNVIQINKTGIKVKPVSNQDLTNSKTESEHRSIIGQKVRLSKNFVEINLEKSSLKGDFDCSCITHFGFTFIEAEQYVYIIGLVRNGLRNICCIRPTCKAHALQKETGRDQFEDKITVIVPHNHSRPSATNKKRQILFHVLRKRLQHNKSLNIKNLFEEFCKDDPNLRILVPLRVIIAEICQNPFVCNSLDSNTFQEFYENVDNVNLSQLHFTHSGQQFFQEKFMTDNGDLAVIFSNLEILHKLSDSKLMYIDASFKIDTNEDFKYQLVTVLLWLEDSVSNQYYPVLYAFVNRKSLEIFKQIFQYVYEKLAPDLRPTEIITDFDASLYYALGEIYVNSHIGGSVFYFTQNLYKKVCSLNLSRDLETNSYFRNIYHMLLMLPLLPVNTISDGFANIEEQARDLGLTDLVKPLFDHITKEWIGKVTPDLFCVHRLENRINENVIAPFKKLRDFLLMSKGKSSEQQISISQVVLKVIELEAFLSDLYTKEDKKSFGRDLSCSQKKNVLRAWLYIESHPKININNFFTKVLGYIKCMENQLWIWGFYGYIGDSDDVLINASHFSIVGVEGEENVVDEEVLETQVVDEIVQNEEIVIIEAVLDGSGKIIIQNRQCLDNYLNSN